MSGGIAQKIERGCVHASRRSNIEALIDTRPLKKHCALVACAEIQQTYEV